MNSTVVPVHAPVGPEILVYCVVFIALVSLVLFGGLNKFSCLYISFKSFCLKIYATCCCCCKGHVQKTEQQAVVLDNLLDEIINV